MTQKINPLLIKTDSAAQGSLLSIGANGPTWTAPAPATDSAQVASIIASTVDSSYVQARQTPQDFAYSSLTGTPNVLDSANVSSIISSDVNSTFINALTIDADTLGGQAGSYYLDYTNATNKPNILDSADVTGIVDSAYVQALQNSNFATEAFVSSSVDSAITALVNAAPTTLDTLNELAAALGDDANFSVTITNAIAAKLDSADAITLIDSNHVRARQDYAYSSLTGTPDLLDSANVVSIINGTVDQAFVNTLSIDASQLGGESSGYFLNYNNFTNTPNILDSADVALIAASIGGVDSAATITLITSTVDSAYVALRAPAGGSSVTVSGTAPVSPSEGDLWFDDSDTGILYVYENSNWTATGIPPAAGVDSADIIQLIDSDYVQARVVVSGVDSASTIALVTSTVDSSYVQARQTPQDFAYSSLTGAPTAVSTFTNDANYIATGDSASLSSLITTGNVIVGGNLQVNGTTVTVNATSMEVTDNMLYMNAGESAGSPTASVDVGWAANVNDEGSYYHVGMFRDATDNTFKVYHEYTPEPGDAVEINTGHASFALAPFAASTLTGVYQGFDSDVTAAGLATQTYVTTTIDSSYVQARQDFAYSSLTGAPTTISTFTNDANYLDSTTVQGVINSAYVNGLVDSVSTATNSINLNSQPASYYLDYTNFTNKPNVLDSADVTLIASAVGGVDSAAITALIDSDYVQSRIITLTGNVGVKSYSYTADSAQTVFTGADDFGFTLAYAGTNLQVFRNGILLVDSDDYVRTTNTITLTAGATINDNVTITSFIADGIIGIDSAAAGVIATSTILSTVDSAYVQARQNYAYSSLTGTPQFISAFTNDAGYLTAATVLDSGEIVAFIDSSYVQARQITQDFAYSSLTGAPNVLDSADVLAIASTVGGVDSAAVLATVAADGYSKYDSTSFTGQLTSAIGSSILAYDANLQSFVTAFTLPTADGTTGQVLVTNGTGTLSFANQSGGGGGGGSVDSASVIAIVNETLSTVDITTIVGTDGQPGDVLQSLGNGQATWQPNVSLSYEFKVTYSGLIIDSVQFLPDGWTLDSQGDSSIAISHNTGRIPKSISFVAYQNGSLTLVNQMLDDILTIPDPTNARNSFKLLAGGGVPSILGTGADANTYAYINLIF